MLDHDAAIYERHTRPPDQLPRKESWAFAAPVRVAEFANELAEYVPTPRSERPALA